MIHINSLSLVKLPYGCVPLHMYIADVKIWGIPNFKLHGNPIFLNNAYC